MSVNVVENFVSEKVCKDIISLYSEALSPVDSRPGFFEDLEPQRPLAPISDYSDQRYLDMFPSLDSKEKRFGAALIADCMLSMKLHVEKFYGVELTKCEGGLVRLEKGAGNGLHSDMYNLDGSPWNDGSGREDELPFSGLLYLSSYKKDFFGGKINFPKNNNLWIEPAAGMFTFFRGDLEHIHEVEKVISGKRHAIVMFCG